MKHRLIALLVLLAGSVLAVGSTRMVFVEGGTFMMGNTLGKNAYPVHKVTVNSFEMSACEITVGEMARVMNWALANGRIRLRQGIVQSNENKQNLLLSRVIGWNEKQFAPKFPTYPCSAVSWYGAATYCNYRSEMEGLNPCYEVKDSGDWECDFKANGYRLPTEAEWEYAARGGKLSRNTLYSGSDILDVVGWGIERGTIFLGKSDTGADRVGDGVISSMQPVGQKQPNELGLFDMSGNLCEWCYDWRADYEDESLINPIGPEPSAEIKSRVTRGGDIRSHELWCRVYSRSGWDPKDCESGFGFRIVRSTSEQNSTVTK